MGQRVWLKQIRSGPSDESGGPDLIKHKFITAARSRLIRIKELKKQKNTMGMKKV